MAWSHSQFWDEGSGAPRFEWPTRVGILEADAQASWVTKLVNYRHAGHTFEIHTLGRKARACTLLVLRGPLTVALQALAHTVPLRAEFTLVVTPDQTDAWDAESLRAIRTASRARAAAAVCDDQPGEVVIQLLDTLAHDRSLADVLDGLRAKVLGPVAGLRQVHVRAWGESLVARAQTLRLRREIAPKAVPLSLDLPHALAQRLSLPQAAAPHEFHARLEATVRTGVFGHEGNETTTLSLAAAAVAAGERKARTHEREEAMRDLASGAKPAGELARPRHLQARARGASDEEVRKMVPNSEIKVQVFVGPLSPDWLGLALPMPAPQSPPPQPSGWPLRVILWDPNYAATPLVRPLLLPEIGASEPIAFSLDGRADAPPLACRITVLDDNEVLQTGMLRVPGSGSVADETPSFLVDAAPQPVLDRTSQDRWFDAAIVLNHGDDGVARATIVQDDTIAVVPLEDAGLKSFVELVDYWLSKIAADPQPYEGLRADGTVALLRELAISGAALHRRLVHDGALDPKKFSGEGPLQVTAAKADSFLPVEFLYRWPAPDDDAQLCTGAEQALKPPKPEGAPFVCPAGCSGQTDRICPLGFWGLYRVIERHTFRAKDSQGMTVPFKFRAADLDGREGQLQPLKRAMIGASDIASAHDTNAVTRLVDDLRVIVPQVERADSWKLWADTAPKVSPSLIVLLPHHATKDNRDYLHLGAESELLAVRIGPEHVGGATGSEAPIVLLIGCETQFTRIQFDDFVSAFRYAGAKIVVTTVATVLGRHAARAADSILASIHNQTDNGPIRMGDAMLAARRQLLAEGMPMALGLTAYGDADWILVSTK
jgi:hypothetical protein